MVITTLRLKQHAWTERDINQLMNLHSQHLSYQEIADKMGLRFNQVKDKIHAVKRGHVYSDRRLWSDAEIETLKRMYPKFTIKTIQRYIRRSRRSIMIKANKLGLRQDYREDWFTPEELGAVLGYNDCTILQHIYDGRLECDVDMSKEATHPKVHRIRYKHARAFIVRYAAELCKRPVDMPLLLDILGVQIPTTIKADFEYE